MTPFFHCSRLAEKLEIARTIGFVSDYFVGAPALEMPIKIWCSPKVPYEVISDYLIHLLDGVTADYELIMPLGEVLEIAPADHPTSEKLTTAEPIAA
jgi:hypothetical protein